MLPILRNRETRPMCDVPADVVCCTGCRATSTLRDAFQFGRTTDGRTGLLCPACLSKRADFENARYVEGMLALGVIGLLLWGVGDVGLGPLLLIMVVAFFLNILIVTPLHELAHALVARMLGLPVYGIVLGWFGKPIWTFQLGRCALVIRRVPLGGMTFAAHRNTRCLRLKEFLVVSAGPALHVVLIHQGWILFDYARDSYWPEWTEYLLAGFLLANAVSLVVTLWPTRYQSPLGSIESDGALLLKLPYLSQDEIAAFHIAYYALESVEQRRRGDFAAAEACCLAGLEQYPENETLLLHHAACLFDLGRYDEVRSLYRRLQEKPDVTAETQAYAAAGIACLNLFLRQDDFLTEADEYSRSAFAALPWLPDVQGIRGGVLIELGQIEAGIELLRQAYEETEDQFNKAGHAAYLALGLIDQEKLAEARDFLAAAERLNAQSRLLDRVRSKLSNETVPVTRCCTGQ
jgi:tetratricopeptide (TPR) repeat protein